MNKVSKIKIPLYDADVIISYGSDYPKILKGAKRIMPATYGIILDDAYNRVIPELNSGGSYVHGIGNPLRIIHVEECWNTPEKIISVISHEALHFTLELLTTYGMEYSKQSEEAFTYLHGYIMEETLKLYIKWGVLAMDLLTEQ